MRNRPKVLVSRKIPFKGLSLLREYCEVTVGAEDRMLTRKELLKLIEGKDGVLSMLTDQMDKEVMDAAPDLKVISNYAVGYDNIDITEATRRGISVTNTPDVLTDATADLAWALLMDVARRVTEGDRLNRKGKWKEWAPMFHLGKEVTGSVLGIVGFGRIGRAMVKRALGFDMEIVYFSRTRLSPAEEQRLGVRYLSFTDLLQHADFVSLHAPYTKETHHLIGADELSRMKATAYLINTSRGGLIDEKALLTALREGKIAGAGLDVYEMEPQLTPWVGKIGKCRLGSSPGQRHPRNPGAYGMAGCQKCIG